ncbi:MAG: sodium:solute symporter, partial [Planctomycetota bacterium]
IHQGQEQAEDDQWIGIPRLPEPTALAGAKVLTDSFDEIARLYVVGGLTPDGPSGTVWEIPLATKPETQGLLARARGYAREIAGEQVPPRPEWTRTSMQNVDNEPVNPYPEGLVAPIVRQRENRYATKQALYILGGWRPSPDGQLHPSRAVWRYTPGENTRAGWERLEDGPADLALFSGVPVGPAHVLLLADREAQPVSGPAGLVNQEPDAFLTYHIYTRQWTDLTGGGEIRGGTIFPADEGFAWIGRREVRGMLSDGGDELVSVMVGAADEGELEYAKKHFIWLDFVVIGLYIVAMIAVGSYFAKKEKNTEDYFLGGRKIPWWAAGLSIYATGISAISFMAIPAQTYAMNWSYICLGIFPPITVAIAAYLFVPLLRGLQITTIMEYFEMRFGKMVRTLSSLLLIFAQVGARMTVVLLLPSLALSAVTGWNVYACVLAMGVLATVYTVMGGISAVIWTDVAQEIVIFGGAMLSLGIIAFSVEGGLGGIVEIGMDYNKFRSLDFSWDLTVGTVWVFTIWAVGDLFARLGQESMQRAFSTRNVKTAKRSMLTSAVISIPGTLLFYFLGAALFAYYHQHPTRLDPTLQTDGTFPLYIAQQLPAGVAGLIIAGLFAASMSTLDSAMNTVATVITRDWFAVFNKDADERRRLYVARWLTVLAGGIGTGLTLYLASMEVRSLWETFSELTGLLGGGFGGIIVLALLTRRANSFGAIVGAILGTLAMWTVKAKFFGYVSFFMYGTFALAISVSTGYLLSLLTNPLIRRKDLTDLTVWTLRRGEPVTEPAPEPAQDKPTTAPSEQETR